jgi:tripartite-type tricarboxylate transporter receptor subunit TctC
MLIVARNDFPAKDLKEWLAYVKANAPKISLAHAGVGSASHLCSLMMMNALNVKFNEITYKGTGPALTDTIGGQVHMMLSTFAPALPLVKSRRLRALGVTSAKRSAATPEIPTLIEAGVAGYDYSTWYGILAPAHTPRTIIDQLHKKTLTALAREDAKRKLEAQGVETTTSTPAEFHAYLKSETRKWIDVVRAAGIPQQ